MSLIEYYGKTCPHCLEMEPLIESVSKTEGVTIERKEVWEDEGNAKELEVIDNGLCGGVPFFWNSDKKTFICGATDEATLAAWARGEEGKGIGKA